MAKDLAQELGYVHIDSGAMYRAVTLYALRHQIATPTGIDEERLRQSLPDINISFKANTATGHPDTYLNQENVEAPIRSLQVSQTVSRIAALPFVRQAMVEQQRRLGKDGGIVMDGRDIGTTVFPNAELKVFVTATPEVRAQRRYDELTAKGQACQYQDILANVRERDYLDTHRAISPLRPAPDALTLDNSHLTPHAQKQWLLSQALRLTTPDTTPRR